MSLRCGRVAQLGGNTGTRVTALTRSLLTWTPEDPPALPAVLPQIRDLLSVEEAIALGISRRDRRFALGLFEVSGLDESRAKSIVHRWLTAECGEAMPGTHAGSQPRIQNMGSYLKAPAFDYLVPMLGLKQHDELRALICDTPSLTAWIGLFRTSGFTQGERIALSELVPALRQRLSLERTLFPTTFVDDGSVFFDRGFTRRDHEEIVEVDAGNWIRGEHLVRDWSGASHPRTRTSSERY